MDDKAPLLTSTPVPAPSGAAAASDASTTAPAASTNGAGSGVVYPPTSPVYGGAQSPGTPVGGYPIQNKDASGQLYAQAPPAYPAGGMAYGAAPQQQQYQAVQYNTTYQAGAPAAGATMQITTTSYATGPVLRDSPVMVTCPHCRNTAITRVEFHAGALAWLACFGLSLFGFICGCCLIPFMIDGTKDATHICTACNQVVGVHRRI